MRDPETRLNVSSKTLGRLAAYCASLVLFAASVQAAPKLRVPDPLHEFATVAEGEAIEHDFSISNAGDSVLEIRKIVPSCGCTAAVIASEKLEPGQSTALKVRFDTNGFRGYKIKTVRLYTNDPDKNSTVFTLQGTVQPPLAIDPPRVNFGVLHKGDTASQQVVIKATKGGIRIEDVRPRSELIKVQTQESPAGTVVTVELDPALPLGVFRSRIAVKTNSDGAAVTNIPVFARVEGDLQPEPRALSFGLVQGPIEPPVSKVVEVVNHSKKPISLLSATSDHPNVSVTLDTREAGKRYALTVGLSGNNTGALRAKIKITTDHEDTAQKELLIPVYAIITRPST